MSIWIKDELAPHSYEKTLITLRRAREEQLVIWIEGTNCKLSFQKDFDGPNPFGQCGGSIQTNTGVAFTKEMLQEIVNSMKEGATLKIASCNYVRTIKNKYDSTERTIFEDFEYDNSMVQIGPNSFKPNIKQDECGKDKTTNG